MIACAVCRFVKTEPGWSFTGCHFSAPQWTTGPLRQPVGRLVLGLEPGGRRGPRRVRLSRRASASGGPIGVRPPRWGLFQVRARADHRGKFCHQRHRARLFPGRAGRRDDRTGPGTARPPWRADGSPVSGAAIGRARSRRVREPSCVFPACGALSGAVSVAGATVTFHRRESTTLDDTSETEGPDEFRCRYRQDLFLHLEHRR